MPPDRVFGRIEQIIYRTQETIVSPKQYHAILKEHWSLKILSQDLSIRNFKECSDTVLKTSFPLLMREQQVFCFEKGKITIKVKNTYTGLYQTHEIIKKKLFKVWEIITSW